MADTADVGNDGETRKDRTFIPQRAHLSSPTQVMIRCTTRPQAFNEKTPSPQLSDSALQPIHPVKTLNNRLNVQCGRPAIVVMDSVMAITRSIAVSVVVLPSTTDPSLYQSVVPSQCFAQRHAQTVASRKPMKGGLFVFLVSCLTREESMMPAFATCVQLIYV